ncbi:MAG: hypothetical protein U5K28_07915 [Halobacteriales archaeon]|nr:hypothetical protein [Halobacteriales archaeon]
MKPARMLSEFPAPSFRGAQEQALEDIRDAFDAGNDVVLVRAPTGSGQVAARARYRRLCQAGTARTRRVESDRRLLHDAAGLPARRRRRRRPA